MNKGEKKKLSDEQMSPQPVPVILFENQKPLDAYANV